MEKKKKKKKETMPVSCFLETSQHDGYIIHYKNVFIYIYNIGHQPVSDGR